MLKLIIVCLVLVPTFALNSEEELETIVDSHQICVNTVSLQKNKTAAAEKMKQKIQQLSNKKVKNQDWQILNGTLADITAFPYQAFLSYCNSRVNKIFMCEGSIITDHHIMSSAQCATEIKSNYNKKLLNRSIYKVLPASDYLVLVGSSVRTEGGQFLGVSRVYVHPQYELEGTLGRDLSVFRTSEKMLMSDKVAQVSLATPDLSGNLEGMEKSRLECVVAGWGSTHLGGPFEDHLRYAKLPLIPVEVCIELGKQSNFHIDRKLHLCTLNRYKDFCSGDCGSALVCNTDGVPRVWGVTSFGEDCAGEQKPGYFARVDNAHSFLGRFLTTHQHKNSVPALLEMGNLKLFFVLVLQMVSSFGQTHFAD